MRFGKTLRESIYPPWKDQYIDYAKLKAMLKEDERRDEPQTWTQEEEQKFTDEVIHGQLNKVSTFSSKTINSLQARVETALDKLKDLTPTQDRAKSDITTGRLKEFRAELDSITDELEELKRYCSINYTGFLKIAKKHDRAPEREHFKIRPFVKVNLSNQGFNSEAIYTPLLKKLSDMYWAVNQHLDDHQTHQQHLVPDQQEEFRHGERYTAHKCKFEKPPGPTPSIRSTLARLC
jgi:SPX domain protein involved in polyphosphate accumulation